MARREINNLWDGSMRVAIDQNFIELYDLTSKMHPARGYFENNRGVDYPLRNMTFAGNVNPIREETKNAIVDAKVFGAKVDCYYRLTMIGNGFTSNGKPRYGVTLEERTKKDFETTGGTRKLIFVYNDDSLAGNAGNADWLKVSDAIETITVDNGEVALSLTIDRSVISASPHPEFMNLNTPYAPTAIIDPSNYFF